MDGNVDGWVEGRIPINEEILDFGNKSDIHVRTCLGIHFSSQLKGKMVSSYILQHPSLFTP